MLKLKISDINPAVMAKLKDMICSLMDETDVLAHNYSNDVTIAVGQEPAKPTKQMELEAANKVFTKMELNSIFGKLIQGKNLFVCIMVRDYSKLLISHFVY